MRVAEAALGHGARVPSLCQHVPDGADALLGAQARERRVAHLSQREEADAKKSKINNTMELN